MSVIDAGNELLSSGVEIGGTGPAPDEELASQPSPHTGQGGWQYVIDHYLIEWGRNPDEIAAEELEPPTPLALRVACDRAAKCRDEGWPPPHRVVPDGEGGISFEHRAGRTFESLNVEANGRVELLTFRDAGLERRQL